MEDEWRTVAFGDLMAIPTRNGIHKGPAFQGRGAPVIKMGEVYKTDIVGDADRDRLELSAAELDRLEVLKNDLLFCRTSLVAAGVGHCAIVGKLSERTTFASNLIRGRLDPDKALARYWFYYFRSPVGKWQIYGLARGTSVTTITGPDIAALRVCDPGLTRQRAIACILGTLDDKIELNRRMNETLEGMARAIFKSWFVDFDPVRAKAAGQQPPGLASHIADLFPDEFEASELGEIPKGWDVGTLGMIANEARDIVQPTEIEPGTPYIALQHMPRRRIALNSWDMADDIASAKLRFKAGDILFGKLRPYFHKVGPAPLDGVCSTDIVVCRPQDDLWYGLTLGHMSSDAFVA